MMETDEGMVAGLHPVTPQGSLPAFRISTGRPARGGVRIRSLLFLVALVAAALYGWKWYRAVAAYRNAYLQRAAHFALQAEFKQDYIAAMEREIAQLENSQGNPMLVAATRANVARLRTLLLPYDQMMTAKYRRAAAEPWRPRLPDPPPPE